MREVGPPRHTVDIPLAFYAKVRIVDKYWRLCIVKTAGAGQHHVRIHIHGFRSVVEYREDGSGR